MTNHSYKDLVVWQRSMELVLELYKLTDCFPKSEIYCLAPQIRRSAISMPANITEGRRRNGKKDFSIFLTTAYSSGAELETLIKISKQLPFSQNLDFSSACDLLSQSMKMLNSMISKLKANEAKKLTKVIPIMYNYIDTDAVLSELPANRSRKRSNLSELRL